MLNNKILLKIVSVIIGFGLWIMVVSGEEKTITMTVPVKLINAPKGMAAISEYPNVSITIDGAARLIDGLENSDILLNIDVSKFPPGVSSRRVLDTDFNTPLGIKVRKVEPSEMLFTIDEISKKDVRLTPSFIGEVKNGYTVESVILKPNVVTISGAKSVLDKIDSITTADINLSDRAESFVMNSKVKEYMGVQSIIPNTTEVRVKLRENLIVKEFSDVPVVCNNLKTGLHMKDIPKLTYVKVKGREDVLDNFLSSVTFLVDCNDIDAPGLYSSTVGYQTGLTIDLIGVEPKKINFEIVE